MVEIRIVIEKKHLFVFAFLLVLFGGVGYVIGYGTTSPSVFGHTLSEMHGNQLLNDDKGVIMGGVDIQADSLVTVLGSTAALGVTNTGIGGNALVTAGNVEIWSKDGIDADNTVRFNIGYWEFRSIAGGVGPNDEILCVGNVNTGEIVAYVDAEIGAWTSGSNAACPTPGT